jgi:hypothetical protein
MSTRLRLVTFAAAMMVMGGAHLAFAQFNEFGGSNLVAKKSYLKAASTTVEFGSAYKPVFTPTEISCTGNGDCLVQVQLSASLDALHPGDYAYAKVMIDGQRLRPYPLDDVSLAFEVPTGDFQFYQTRGFTWLQEVTPGTHTITVEMRSESNFTTVGGRTLSVSVFK